MVMMKFLKQGIVSWTFYISNKRLQAIAIYIRLFCPVTTFMLKRHSDG